MSLPRHNDPLLSVDSDKLAATVISLLPGNEDGSGALFSLKTAKILIVDDNQKNSFLLQSILATEGYSNIISINSGAEVTAFLDSTLDLILLDLNMPEVNGFDVLRTIRDDFSHLNLPVIVISAMNDSLSKIRALKLGAKDFIVKPIDRFEALNRIANTLESRQNYLKVLSHNKTLEEEVAVRTAELQAVTEDLRISHKDTLKRLANAASLRDNETGHHLDRMTEYSCMLARKLNWSESDIEYLRHAAPMHDLGKIAIPDNILLKPGKLSPDEFDIMKQHALIGAKMLSGSSSKIIRMAETIALTHHEKWDGSGYPYGLAGQEIPEVGRIVSVADCFDALTSVRPYKKAWPVNEALEYLKQHSGIWYDPTVVDALIHSIADIQVIRAEYSDEETQ